MYSLWAFLSSNWQVYADLNNIVSMCVHEARTKAPAYFADVAPYSREYNTFRQIVGKQAQGNTELEIEYEKILNRVKRTRESVIRMNDRHFTRPVDEISGTVEEVSPGGITLKEFPGRVFQFSSVSTSAADMSARILGENNNMTRCLHPAGHQNPRARATSPSRSINPVRIQREQDRVGFLSRRDFKNLARDRSIPAPFPTLENSWFSVQKTRSVSLAKN